MGREKTKRRDEGCRHFATTQTCLNVKNNGGKVCAKYSPVRWNSQMKSDVGRGWRTNVWLAYKASVGLPSHPSSRMFVKWTHHYVLYSEYWGSVLWGTYGSTEEDLSLLGLYSMSIDSFGGMFCLHLHGLSPCFNLSFYLHRLLSGLFPTDLPTKTLYVFLFPPIYSKCPPISYFTWSPERYARYMNFSAIRTGSVCLCLFRRFQQRTEGVRAQTCV
jgi:hypothetical protein